MLSVVLRLLISMLLLVIDVVIVIDEGGRGDKSLIGRKFENSRMKQWWFGAALSALFSLILLLSLLPTWLSTRLLSLLPTSLNIISKIAITIHDTCHY